MQGSGYVGASTAPPCHTLVDASTVGNTMLWTLFPPLAIQCFVRASSLCRRRFHCPQYNALSMPLTSAGSASIGRYRALPTWLRSPQAALPLAATGRFLHGSGLHRQRFHWPLQGASYMPPASTGSASIGCYRALPTCLPPPQAALPLAATGRFLHASCLHRQRFRSLQ